MASKNALYDPHRTSLLRSDYRPSEYRITDTKLDIKLDPDSTIVNSVLSVEGNPKALSQGGALILDGEDMALLSAEIGDGKGGFRPLDRSEFYVTEKNLIIKNPPSEPFQLRISNEINPGANTGLMGIYASGDIICSQCEADGFRKITYYLDRPDNLAVFDVTLTADKAKYPVLLSNGNGDFKQSIDNGDGTHSVRWNDPWPKPSYLFATVAGNLKVLEETFVTMSGKEVAVRIFVQPEYEKKIDWAMDSILRAMKWDEVRYGREYDLDMFHIVAVDKFNMGAMENKGLNVYNVSALVGSPDTSTDTQLMWIDDVLAHEYAHNYTGDRVTVQNWFELTLKEGLTVLRDRQYMEDHYSQKIKRIDDAMHMRTQQFPEDGGAMSHPIRPDFVEDFNNIYSRTIYDKGSHVLGMIHTMLGEKTWRAAMDNYFEKFDGQAVTTDDFVNNMQDFSPIDLTQFRKWYGQSGTPEISYSGEYDADAKIYRLTLTQESKPTADQKVKENLHIPVSVGLIGESGKDIALNDAGDTTVILHLREKTQTFEFKNVDGSVVLSVLRGFSAPVKLATEPSDAELIFRMSHDSDSYNKFDAAQTLMVKTIRGAIHAVENGQTPVIDPAVVEAYRLNVMNALDGDLAFNARMLTLPSYDLITQGLAVVNPDHVLAGIKAVSKPLAETFKAELLDIYNQTQPPEGEAYKVVPEQIGRRELHNLSLSMLASIDPFIAPRAYQQFRQADNMTERLAGLSALVRNATPDKQALAESALQNLYEKYSDDKNVVDLWLRHSAMMPSADPIAQVKSIMKHPAFDETNPNKVRALLYGFMYGNIQAFHNRDGSGYAFIADQILHYNKINPDNAVRFTDEFTQVKKYDKERQVLMVEQMDRIMAQPGLAKGIKEIIGKSLETVDRKALATAAGFKAAATRKNG